MTDAMAKKILGDILDEMDGHTTPKPQWSNTRIQEHDKREAMRVALKKFDEYERLIESIANDWEDH